MIYFGYRALRSREVTVPAPVAYDTFRSWPLLP